MLLLNERDVTELLPLDSVLDALQNAFKAQALGEISMPLRTLARAPGGVLGAMPSSLGGEWKALGAKLVTFFPPNAEAGLPTHNALIALFDSQTGLPLAVMDGRYITEIRTAATSALATQALARNTDTIGMLGTGVQARAHVEALAHVCKPGDLRVWGRNSARAQEIARFARARGFDARTAASPAEASKGANVICTVTSTREPILSLDDVEPGTHINSVGFAGPGTRELASDLMAAATIITDSLDGAQYESGNIILAIKDGALPPKPNLTLLCDVLAGREPGRRRADEITVFDSLGIGIEDVACARVVYERARDARLGTTFEV